MFALVWSLRFIHQFLHFGVWITLPGITHCTPQCWCSKKLQKARGCSSSMASPRESKKRSLLTFENNRGSSPLLEEAHRRTEVLVEDARLYSGRLQKAQMKLASAHWGKLARGRGLLGGACQRSWMPHRRCQPLFCISLSFCLTVAAPESSFVIAAVDGEELGLALARGKNRAPILKQWTYI